MSLLVTDLSKRYGNDWVLRDVSFAAEPGEIVSVFTESGAAASAILKLIAGEESSNGGSITLGPFSPYLFPSRNSFGGVNLLGIRIGKSNPAAATCIEPNSISEAPDGSLFLLDCPFTATYKTERSKIGEALHAAVDGKASAAIFTTLDFKDAIEYSDRTLVILKGIVEQIAPPQDIYDHPASVSVAAAVGRNNLITARRLTSSKTDVPEFVTIDGEHRLFAQRTDKNSLGAINRNVTLAIRPEQISISFGASFPEDNLLKATVAAVKPMGPTTRVKLDCGGLHLEALVLRLVGLEIGDECMVGLPPDRIAVLAQ